MFKTSIIFVTFLLLEIVCGDPIKPPFADLKDDVEAAIYKAFDKCCPNKQQQNEIFQLISAGKSKEDPVFKKIIYCVYNETGYIEKDGKLIVEKAAAAFENKAPVNDVLHTCDKDVVVVSDPVEVVHQLYKCFQEKSPLKIALSVNHS